MPDLVILLMGESDFVQPLEFLSEICINCNEDLGAVEPNAPSVMRYDTTKSTTSGCYNAPHGVMRSIHVDDFLR